MSKVEGMGRAELIAAFEAACAERDALAADLARVPDRARRMLPLENMTREDLVDALKEAWQDELASHVAAEESEGKLRSLLAAKPMVRVEGRAGHWPATMVFEGGRVMIEDLGPGMQIGPCKLASPAEPPDEQTLEDWALDCKNVVASLTHERDELKADLAALTAPIAQLREQRDAAFAELWALKAARSEANLPKVIVSDEITVLSQAKLAAMRISAEDRPVDWTMDPATGRANSSVRFLSLVGEIERCIRGDAHKLIAGRADATAHLVLAQLAHVHGLVPSSPASPASARTLKAATR